MNSRIVAIVVVLVGVVFLVAGTEGVDATDYPIRTGSLLADRGIVEPAAPVAGITSRVLVASDWVPGDSSSLYPSISADGRYVAFHSSAGNLVPGDTNGVPDVFVHDRGTGQTSRVSVASDGTQANGSSAYPSTLADGRYVAFDSGASNLVPGDANFRSGLHAVILQATHPQACL